MKLVLLTGGARSGKSTHAVQLAREAGGDDVTFIATAVASDAEMAARIRAHRKNRPESWRTLERESGAGNAALHAGTDVVLLDCVTILLSNAMVAVDPPTEIACKDAAALEVGGLMNALRQREGTLIAVTNEVGMGVVPPTPLGRWFRDVQGRANQRLARVADRVVMLVSGIPMEIKG